MSCIHLLYCDKSHYQNFTPPFDIPESWQWVRLGDYVINRDGERVPIASTIRSKQSNKIYDYYGAAGAIDKVDNYIFDERLLLIGEDGANLLSRTKDNAFFADGKYWVNNHAHVLDSSDKFLLEFVALYINTIPLDDYITGSAQPKLSQDNLNNIHLPIPPIEEQRRILTMIESLMSIICEIRESKQQLSQSIALTKSKILDLAMQGKLVPQDPADEPAAEMLRRVNPKAKIITDNPHSWNIPNTWTWCQLGDIFQHNTGKALNSSNRDGIEYEYITTSNVYWNRFELDDLKKMPFKKNELEKCTVRHGDLLVCEGGDVGRAAIWNLDRNIMIQNHLHRLRPIANEIHIPLYYHVFRHYKDKDLIGGKGIALQGFSSKSLHQLAIPLPPYNEQKRIVAKIEELYSVLDQIEASLQS
ncbi:type-1 restriction enzyme EcoKI specificity protein [Muribaculaceae bacterium]|nr:type-1 restriction enzyme EcoKI specificity protein [Muribaculaceae bacterium]